MFLFPTVDYLNVINQPLVMSQTALVLLLVYWQHAVSGRVLSPLVCSLLNMWKSEFHF